MLRSPRCVVCGRKVRGLEDARNEGGRWYCSHSHFLQAESAGTRGRRSPGRKPLKTARRIVKWTLIVAGLLFVGLLIAATFVSTGKNHAKPHWVRRVTTRAPRVPLGRAAAVGQGWTLRVLSATPNAGPAIRAVSNPYAEPTPAGARDYIVRVAATYVAGGKASIYDLANRIHAVGRHRAAYSLTVDKGCGPGRLHLPRPTYSRRLRRTPTSSRVARWRGTSVSKSRPTTRSRSYCTSSRR